MPYRAPPAIISREDAERLFREKFQRDFEADRADWIANYPNDRAALLAAVPGKAWSLLRLLLTAQALEARAQLAQDPQERARATKAAAWCRAGIDRKTTPDAADLGAACSDLPEPPQAPVSVADGDEPIEAF
jgi:elongation factor P--beta-lysine ligase